MAGLLSRVFQRTSRHSGTGSSVWAGQQRSIGDLPVKPNKHIEDWATYREHVEDTFSFDAKTLAIMSLTIVAFPTLLYNVMTKEFDKADDKAGRARKDLM